VKDADIEYWVEVSALLEQELRSEKTSYLIFWVAHPTQLRDDLTQGRFDAVKPSQAMACFVEVGDAIAKELDARIPARGDGA
jgi:hypothetical protein